MPYKTKAERERENWLTGKEAIDRIQLSERCQPRVAWRQLQNAIADKVIAVKWDSKFSLPFDSDRPPDEETPPNHESFWRNTLMRYSDAFVLDYRVYRPIGDPDAFTEFAVERGGFYRPILVARRAVETHWPIELGFPETTSKPQASSTLKKKGRPSPAEAIRQTLSQMKKEGASFNKIQKALAAEVAAKNGKSLGDKGWHDRTVVQHISKWLKDVGLSPR